MRVLLALGAVAAFLAVLAVTLFSPSTVGEDEHSVGSNEARITALETKVDSLTERVDAIEADDQSETAEEPEDSDEPGGNVDGYTIEIAAEQSGGYSRSSWGYSSSSVRRSLGCTSSQVADHIVTLFEAHESGGHAWSSSRKRTFANDLSNLRCVNSSNYLNRGSRDLAEYGSGPEWYRCLIDEIAPAVKSAYGLTMDSAEAQAHNQLTCTGSSPSSETPQTTPPTSSGGKNTECHPWGDRGICYCTYTSRWLDNKENCP